MNKVHDLKCWTPHFKNVKEGLKTFEIRENDRDFKVGDCLHLREWNAGNGYTGDECFVLVTHMIQAAKGLSTGFCIMSCRLLVNENKLPVWRWQLLCQEKRNKNTLDGYLFSDDDHCLRWFSGHDDNYLARWKLRLVKAVHDNVEESPIVIESQPPITVQEFRLLYHASRAQA